MLSISAKSYLFITLLVVLMFPKMAAAEQGCECSGSAGLNAAGQAAVTTFGITEAQLTAACQSQGGTYGGWTCSGLKMFVSTAQADCEAEKVKAKVMEQLGIPYIALAAVNYSVSCSWKEKPVGAATLGSNPAAAPTAGTAGKKAETFAPVKLQNPLGSTVEATDIIGGIIKGALGIVGSLALLMLVLGGFRWLTSAGSSEKIEQGTKTMVWAVIGVFLVFASYLLLSTFTEYLTGAK